MKCGCGKEKNLIWVCEPCFCEKLTSEIAKTGAVDYVRQRSIDQGAAIAFGIMGMVEAIRERYAPCRECGGAG